MRRAEMLMIRQFSLWQFSCMSSGRMKIKFFSQVLFASSLLTASAGLSLLVPVAQAQETPAPAVQKMTKADRELTQKIRKSVVADKSLSVEAHNIHITARDGAVTLTGTVKSDEEKNAVESKATEIAGAGKVTDNLAVSQK